MMRGALPVERVLADPYASVGRGWPWTLPCVEQLLTDGLELGPLTVFVGENGSGKSTLIEGLAQAYGLSPEGGSTGARHSTRVTESPLSQALQLRRGPGAAKWGFFLRAETMHGFYTYLEQNPSGPLYSESQSGRESFHERSHGESFIEVFQTRFSRPGFYLLDEPESALSFTGCLGLVGLLVQMADSGVQQAVVATHSPIIAATPGATIYEIGPDGITRRDWAELELVHNWRSFLDDPQRYLRHIID